MDKSSLKPGLIRLLETMQRINYGSIEQLPIIGGEPMFDSTVKITREIKFGAENGARRELTLDDFALKTQVLDLVAQLCKFQDGIVLKLEIQAGLPFRMTVGEHAA